MLCFLENHSMVNAVLRANSELRRERTNKASRMLEQVDLPERSLWINWEQEPKERTRVGPNKAEANSKRVESSQAKKEGRSLETRNSIAKETSQPPRTQLRDWNSLTGTWTNTGSRQETLEWVSKIADNVWLNYVISHYASWRWVRWVLCLEQTNCGSWEGSQSPRRGEERMKSDSIWMSLEHN